MKKLKILFITSNSMDTRPINVLNTKFTSRGHSVFVFDCLSTSSVDGDKINWSDAGFMLKVKGTWYELSFFDAIIPFHYKFIKNIDNANYEISKYIEVQHKTLMNSLLYYCSQNNKIMLVNNLLQSYLADHKILQLTLASEIGLLIPSTLVGNESSTLKKLIKNSDRILIKTLGISNIKDHVLPSRIVDKNKNISDESVSMCPSIYQDCIEKDFELRIMYVDGKTFATKINSQIVDDPDIKIDWRFRTIKDTKENYIPITKYELPLEVDNKLKVLMQKLQLDFGAIDMIVDKNANHIFLEVNPNGQWQFFEMSANLKISDAIVEMIEKKCESH